ncbi:MAG: protocatechuate 3,4-dioxygenase subunit alpha [Trueperaceae bacterium]
MTRTPGVPAAQPTQADVRLGQSPSQTVGPFFHDALIRASDDVLVDEGVQGERIVITGRVIDGGGNGVPDAMLEIWHADASGIYPHPTDPDARSVDPRFRGFGRARTDDTGRYRFETVKPGVSNADHGRFAPHVQVHVFARGMLTHATTRIYFEGDDLRNDEVLRLVDEDRRGTLVAKRDPRSR